MWTENSKFYDEGFRVLVIDIIQQERPIFRQAHSGDDFMEFGRRFQDVEEVWQAVCMLLESKITPVITIPVICQTYLNCPEELKKLIWAALKMAAETDYHYKYEKKYYEEPIPEVEKEDV